MVVSRDQTGISLTMETATLLDPTVWSIIFKCGNWGLDNIQGYAQGLGSAEILLNLG